MAKKAEVIITCNAASAKAVIESLNRELNRAIQEREQLLAIEKQQGKLTADQAKRDKELKNIISSLTTAQQKNTEEMRKYNQVIKDLAGSKTKDLKRALGEVKRELDKMSARDPKRQQLINDMQRIQKQIDANTGATKRFGATHNGVWQTAVRNIMAYMGVMAGFNKIKSMVESVFKTNLKLSDSLADIRKVSGLTMGEINQLYNSIAKIDTRNTIETLNQLAYTGAKLGIGQNYGVQGLLGFVKAAEQVQMALGEDMGEKALPELAKMTEVMGLIDNYGVEQAMQKTASAIFQLGATSTATGTNIVEFSKRLYGLANVSNVSADELLALGSAADAMGLMPEVAATAFNKLFTSLQRNHNLIEKSLSIPPGTINELYSAGKTMDAIVMIFEKMKETGNLNALGGVFKDLGSDGARLVNVMATMSDRVDILRKHLKTSQESFKEGEAVIAEYMIQNETAAAKMERASNIWIKAFANPEGVDMVKEMADEWYRLSKEMTQNTAIMYQLQTTLKAIALIIETIIKISPFLIHALAFAGALSAIRGIYFGIVSLVNAIRTATTAQMTLNAAMKSNVVLAMVSAVASLAAMWYEAAKAEEWAAEREAEHQAELQKAYAASKEAINDSVRPLKSYKKAMDDANLSEKERVQLVKDFKGDYQDYLDYLGIEVNTVDDLAAAYADVVKIMKQKRAYEERENYRDRVNGENKMNRIAAGAEVERELKKMKAGEGIDKAWVMANQSKGTKAVYDAIMKQTYGVGAYEVKGTGSGRWAIREKGKIRELTNNALWNAIDAYIGNVRTEQSLNKTVNDMFKDDVGNFDIDKWNEERMKNRLKRKGGLEVEKPDKAAAAAAKQAAQDAKQALRKDLKDAKEESDAIISKIEEWYRLQESVITGMAADGKLTQEQAEQATRTLNIAKNTALRDARLAISGRNTEAWEQTKQQIGSLMIDQGQWSQELLAQILEVSMISIRQNLARIDKGGGQFGITTSSLRDAVDKNAAGNQREINRIINKSAIEVEKLLDQYHFVDVALKSFSNRLEQMGILTDTAEQLANRLKTGAQPKQTEQAKRNLLQAFINSGAAPYSVNPDDTASLTAWMQQFTGFGVGYNKGIANYNFNNFSEPFAGDFALWLSQPETYKAQIQAFYFALLQSSDQYYQAQRQQYEFYKKQNQQQWENSGRKDFYEQTYTGLENRQKMQDAFGTGQSFGQQYGLVDTIARDPEVELYKQKLAAAAEYYQFVESHQHTEQELREASQATLEAYMAMAQKVGDEVAERASKIQELSAPMEEFAEDAGQKLGDMLFNMESQSMTWNAIIKKMILSYAQMTIKMTAENLTKKLQQALFYKQMETMETQHQTQMLAIQTAFGAMRIGAQQTMNTTGQAVKSADDATTVSKEVTLATILTQLGISEGAAKIIGKLGWWGIPLIGVISSLLLGLLSSALSTAGKASSNSNNNTKVKLVSGMLTYDEGNVSQYVGNDGHVYSARQQGSLPEGVSLVRQPIATTVNGQPSLVAEKGPEIVIGRRTTRQIMMNEPGLLRRIAQIERGSGFYTRGGMRTLDSGNLEDVFAIDPTSGSSPARGGESLDSETLAALKALPTALAAFTQLMGNIQQKGIPAKMAAFGDGSLDEGMRTVSNFRKKYPAG